MSIAEALPAWYRKTRAGRECAVEEAARAETERIEHAKALEEIREQAEKDAKPLCAAVEKARDKLQRLHGEHSIARSTGLDVTQRADWIAKIAKAEAAHLVAEQELARVTGTATAAVAVHENFLAANQPESIAAFHIELERLIAEAQAPAFLIGMNKPAGWNPETGKQIVETRTNSDARRQRILALSKLRAENRDQFWLRPWTVEELEAEQGKRLAAICDGKTLS